MNLDIFALCITPPSNARQWWAEWSFAPEILLPFAACFYLYVRGSRDHPLRALALGGWTLMGLALLSPLCRLAAGLVSAHMIQLALISIVAPAMMAAGGVVPAIRRALRSDAAAARDPRRTRAALSTSAIAYGVAIWLWHAPPIYNASVALAPVHVGVAAAIVFAAMWFFHRVLTANESQTGAAILVLLVTMAHTGFLGALLTFAPEPLYRSDAYALSAWGLSAMSDQQLAGLIMWAPSGLLYLCVALVLTARLIATPADLVVANRANDGVGASSAALGRDQPPA